MVKITYASLTYIILLVIFLLNAILPIFGLNIPFDPTIAALGSILVIYTIALILLREMPRIRRLKFSPSGLEAELSDLEMRAKAEEKPIPLQVKREIQEIKKTTGDPGAIFLEVVIEVEKKLRLIASKVGLNAWKYATVPHMVDELLKSGTIDSKLADFTLSFWRIRNRLIHGEVEISEKYLDDIIEIGERVLSMLTEAYESID